ncbi:MAG: class I SAM-dependent methyltransferase [Gammaproteobacteria bacterium]|nr:MAG: class I SAM-dependent methyltransferase [Gammaproteobacteria bacterium]
MSEIEASGPNEAQIEYWNSWMGERWVQNQEDLDQLLAPLSEAAISAAGVRRNERALDVGCGCGATSLVMADRGAITTGIDVSRPMLEHARTRAEGRSNPEFVLADAALHEFNGDFDLLFSRFGVMFFVEPVAAFANLRSALRSGGRVCFLCWQPADRNPWVSVPMAAVLPFLPPSEPVDPRAPGPFAFGDADYVSDILTQAGFDDVQAAPLERPLSLGQNATIAAEFVTRIGPVSRVLVDLDEARRNELVAEVRTTLSPYERAEGVALGAACWIVTAVNP